MSLCVDFLSVFRLTSAATVSDASKPSALSRLIKWGGGLLLVGLLLVLLAPTIIAKTPLRDMLVNSALSNEGVVVSTGRASFGYFSPLSIHNLDVKSTNGAMNLKIDNIATDRSWLLMLLESEDLGTFRFEKPDVEVVTGIAPSKDQKPLTKADGPRPSPPPMPKLVAEITDAGFRVRNVGAQEPAVKLDGIDVHRTRGAGG